MRSGKGDFWMLATIFLVLLYIESWIDLGTTGGLLVTIGIFYLFAMQSKR